MEIALLTYCLTVLIPILGGIWLGIRLENRRKRQLLKAMWTMRLGGRK